MRVLVADDEPEARTIFCDLLKEIGHSPIEAVDGEHAWLEFDKKPFPVVISDRNMPGLNGLDLCAKIRKRPRTDYAYFILVTASGDTRETLVRATNAGIDDLLHKPVDRALLLLRLRVAERILSLESRVEELQGFLPICAYCKRIRNDQDEFEKMESFIEKRSGATFSHTYCPDCVAKHFPKNR